MPFFTPKKINEEEKHMHIERGKTNKTGIFCGHGQLFDYRKTGKVFGQIKYCYHVPC